MLREAVAAAKDVLTAGGHALTPSTLDAVRDTLSALPSPEANGRLTRPLAPRGLEALAGLVLAARRKAEAALARAREDLEAADAAVAQAERDLATRQAARVAARESVKRAQPAVEELSFGR